MLVYIFHKMITVLTLNSLTDMENALVGCAPYLASFMKPLMDKVDPEVVCFGCVLFEVCTRSLRRIIINVDTYCRWL
jgi:hypothetical protein